MSDVELGFDKRPPAPASAAHPLNGTGMEAHLLRAHQKKDNSLSRAMDMIRQLVLVGTLVLIVLLIIGSFADHPAINVKHKYFALGGLITVCSGYAISLWLVRGQPVILLLLVVIGTSVLMFALGWTVSELRRGFV